MTKVFFFDISGVLYQDGRAIDGAAKALADLDRRGIEYRLLTNTSRQPRARVLKGLQAMGFEVQQAGLFTAPDAIRRHLQAKGLRPYCLIHPDLSEDFAGLDQENPNAVVVTDAGERFDYPHLNRAFELLQAGAPLLAVGLNRYFRQEGRLALDAGPFVRALEFAAGVKAEILGKPAPGFFHQVRQSLPDPDAKILMIGDDWEADVQGALGAGLQGALVATGKYRPGDENKLDAAAAGCFPTVVEAIDWGLKQGGSKTEPPIPG